MTGEELRAARERLRFKPKHMAEVLGVSRPFISNMENNKVKIPSRIAVIVRALLSGWRPPNWKDEDIRY